MFTKRFLSTAKTYDDGLRYVGVGCVGGNLDITGDAEASASGVQVCRVLFLTSIVCNKNGCNSRGS